MRDPTAKNIPFRHKELRVGVQDVAFGDDGSHVAVQVRASPGFLIVTRAVGRALCGSFSV